MALSREFELVEAVTRKRLGTISLSEATLPGDLVLRFRRDEIQLEAMPVRPGFAGAPGVTDARSSKSWRKKPA